MALIVFGYAAMHFLVDFICAWAMFFRFSAGADGYINILIYNFCAFALQMPLGTILDARKDNPRLPMIWSICGAALTTAGALLHPALLGLGNAMFHVGGGMDVIREDFAQNRRGADLGIFVAPGALGLYFGGILADQLPNYALLLIAGCLLAALSLYLLMKQKSTDRVERQVPRSRGVPVLLVCCFAVVVFRSWAGLGISFPWKAEYGLLSVLASAMGKALGGIAAARFGMGRTMRVSLVLSSGCFLLGNHPVCGILALLLFNMTMPVTLYLLAEQLPHLPGFSFGLLTFGLFLGFLPVYAGVDAPIPGTVFGCLVSLGSLLLLYMGLKAVKQDVLS